MVSPSQNEETSTDVSTDNLEMLAPDFFETRRYLPPMDFPDEDGITVVADAPAEAPDEEL